jgi:hypothetical protein
MGTRRPGTVLVRRFVNTALHVARNRSLTVAALFPSTGKSLTQFRTKCRRRQRQVACILFLCPRAVARATEGSTER